MFVVVLALRGVDDGVPRLPQTYSEFRVLQYMKQKNGQEFCMRNMYKCGQSG